MIIPRLLALGALTYAGLRLRKRLKGGDTPVRRRDRDAEPVRDLLVEDPICGKLVPSREALTLETAGGARHFCSEACRLAFGLQTGRTGRSQQTEQAQGERTA